MRVTSTTEMFAFVYALLFQDCLIPLMGSMCCFNSFPQVCCPNEQASWGFHSLAFKTILELECSGCWTSQEYIRSDFYLKLRLQLPYFFSLLHFSTAYQDFPHFYSFDWCAFQEIWQKQSGRNLVWSLGFIIPSMSGTTHSIWRIKRMDMQHKSISR